MPTYFLSDLHLEAAKPHLTAIFTRFMAGPARQADRVYLLGDIFEVWVGDDDRSAFVRSIERSLREASDAGVRIFFMVGNRDFLVRRDFASRSGVTLLEDPTVVDVGGVQTLLTHGDRYCTDDEAYQRFRAKARTDEWQKKILDMPLFVRRLIAWWGRRKSRANHSRAVAAGYISDVVEAEVVAEMNAKGVRRLIHGHTHRPAVHSVPLDGGVGERIVLADWRETGEALAINADGSYTRMPLEACR